MKKTISLILVLLLLAGISMQGYATDVKHESIDEYVSPTEDYAYTETDQDNHQDESYVPQGMEKISVEELQQWLEDNEQELSDVEDIPSSKSATWIYTRDTSHGFYYYAQEYSKSCGPACVRMSLKGLSALTLTESEIRTGCGMTSTGANVANMKTYMNSKQNDYSFADKHSILASLFHSNMYTAVTNGAPPLVGIETSVNDGWFYTTNGHCIACYAIKSDKSYYLLADPIGGYLGVSAWKWYSKSAYDLWNAYSSQCGYIA